MSLIFLHGRLFWGLILFFISSHLSPSSLAETQNNYEELLDQCPEIRINNDDWIYWDHLQNTESGIGKSLELMTLINHHLPVKVVPTTRMPFTRELFNLKKGELDASFGVYPLPERLASYEFTDSFYDEGIYAFTVKNYTGPEITINNLGELKGAWVRGTSYGISINEIIKTAAKNWVSVAEPIQAKNMLVSGRIDVYIASSVEIDFNKFPTLRRQITPIDFQKIAAAFSKKTDCRLWIPHINKIIKEYILDPNKK